MTNNGVWKFSVIPNIEESTFNKVLEKFYDNGISGLTRENIQNSLDGKLPDSTEPVLVTIKTGKINKDHIPGIDEIKERILSLEGRNSYTKETINHMKNKMNSEMVDYISFEDSNTKGLTGANNGQSGRKEDTWGIYAYNKGVHFEEEDSTLEKVRGGSHGIGKIASNAASDLHIMFFANCDKDGNKHLGGTVQLIEHKYKDNYYRSTGYFTDIRKEENIDKFYPYKNTFNEVFAKNSRGLKIIIPYLREQFNNEINIIRSICDSFFIAILQEKLVVIVNDKEINSKTIEKYVLNEKYYVQEVGEIKENFTPLYYRTYLNSAQQEIELSDKFNTYRFKVYFNYDNEISKGRVAIIRTIGMKIQDKKIKGNVNKPFNAILIPSSTKEDAYLKSLENESHTEISFEHIKDLVLQKSAKKFINAIDKKFKELIENEIKKNNPTDGKMNTDDILYEVQNDFKRELSKSLSTVRVKDGSKNIVKVNDNPPKRKSKSVSSNTNERKARQKKKSISKGKKTNYEDSYDGEKVKEMRYSANPDRVERIILGDKEIVKFDFTDSTEVRSAKVCDVGISVVDGMGEEYLNQFSIKENYESIIDKSINKQCTIADNLIKNIKIDKGIVQMELKLKSGYNKALKFVYYVEV